MPKLLNTSGLKACTRLLLTMMSMPLQWRQTESPQGMRIGSPCCGHFWIMSSTMPFTETVRSSGSPDIGPILPPSRRSSVAPTPPDMATCTAIGSHIIATPASLIPRSSIALSMNVASLGAPPPALSARSAITTGPAAEAAACVNASSMDRGVWSSSRRIAKIYDRSLRRRVRPGRGRRRLWQGPARRRWARRPGKTVDQ